MPKFLIRFAASVLVTCLLADPALATPLQFPLTLTSETIMGSIISENALCLNLGGFTNPIINRAKLWWAKTIRIPRNPQETVATIAVAAWLVEIAWQVSPGASVDMAKDDKSRTPTEYRQDMKPLNQQALQAIKERLAELSEDENYPVRLIMNYGSCIVAMRDSKI